MKTFLTLLLALVPVLSFAAFKTPAETRFLMNQGYGSTVQLGSQLIDKKVHTLKAQYDFANLGGTSGSKNLLDVDGKAAKLPDNAIVVDCLIDVITAPTSTGVPTLAISTGESAADIKAATALGSYTGLVACIPVGSAATSIKMTAERTPTITVTTVSVNADGTLTAGKLNVLIQYLLSD